MRIELGIAVESRLFCKPLRVVVDVSHTGLSV
jgi:hypothetical protein